MKRVFVLDLIKSSNTRLLGAQEVRDYLHLNHQEEKNLLEGFIDTATAWVEEHTGRSLLTKQYRLKDSWMRDSKGELYVKLPRPPFRELVSISPSRKVYVDSTRDIARLRLKESTAIWEGDLIEIVYEAGYGDLPTSVPSMLRQAVCMVVADLYEHRGTQPIAKSEVLNHLLGPFVVICLG